LANDYLGQESRIIKKEKEIEVEKNMERAKERKQMAEKLIGNLMASSTAAINAFAQTNSILVKINDHLNQANTYTELAENSYYNAEIYAVENISPDQFKRLGLTNINQIKTHIEGLVAEANRARGRMLEERKKREEEQVARDEMLKWSQIQEKLLIDASEKLAINNTTEATKIFKELVNTTLPRESKTPPQPQQKPAQPPAPAAAGAPVKPAAAPGGKIERTNLVYPDENLSIIMPGGGPLDSSEIKRIADALIKITIKSDLNKTDKSDIDKNNGALRSATYNIARKSEDDRKAFFTWVNKVTNSKTPNKYYELASLKDIAKGRRFVGHDGNTKIT
jgi:hypothetical protein